MIVYLFFLVLLTLAVASDYAESALHSLVTSDDGLAIFPVLPTSMGRGVIPDAHAASVSAARSLALSQADLVVVVGAKLDWMFEFGRPPRFNKDAMFVFLCRDVMSVPVTPSPSSVLVGSLEISLQLLRESLRDVNLSLGIAL